MKIVVCSDNHSNIDALRKIVDDNPNCDYYWHLGDSEAFDEKELYPFFSVLGNNDYLNLPYCRIIELRKHRILLSHGHRHLRGDLHTFYYYAKENDCDVVLYGHTHMFSDYTYNDVRFINPGSCSRNRDGSDPSYIILNIDEVGNIKVIKKFVDLKNGL